MVVKAELTVGTGANPIVVTASADDDEGTITLKTVDVAFIVWSGCDEATDTCEIQNTAGDTVFIFPADANMYGSPMVSPRIDKKFDGLVIPTNGMDAGVIHIYRND
jgi:hypothetical protein